MLHTAFGVLHDAYSVWQAAHSSLHIAGAAELLEEKPGRVTQVCNTREGGDIPPRLCDPRESKETKIWLKKKKQTPEGENQPDLKPNPEAALGFLEVPVILLLAPCCSKERGIWGICPKTELHQPGGNGVQ